MPLSRKDTQGARVFAFPLFGIALLLCCYWILAEWPELPKLINTMLASVHWTR